MGTGEFDFAGLGAVLREMRWPGWLIVEVSPHRGMPSRRVVETARDYLRKSMQI